MTEIARDPFAGKASARPDATGNNRLPTLASEIEAAHQRCKAGVYEALDAALAAGRALIEAKELVPHGQWQDWLRANVPEVSIRTAQRYMRAAERVKSDTVSFSSLRELLQPERPREPTAAADWWWRGKTPEQLEAWWSEYPQDLGAAVAALHEDGGSPDAIAAEVRTTPELVRMTLAEDLWSRPRFVHEKPPRHQEDLECWQRNHTWGERFDQLFGLMVRVHGLRRRGTDCTSAYPYACAAGKPELAERLWQRALQFFAEALRLLGEAATLESDPLTRITAAGLAVSAWEDPEPFRLGGFRWRLSHLIVGFWVNGFLDGSDEERSRWARALAAEQEFPAKLTLETIAKPLAERAKAADVMAGCLADERCREALGAQP